jgi:hypothetical protein
MRAEHDAIAVADVPSDVGHLVKGVWQGEHFKTQLHVADTGATRAGFPSSACLTALT